MKASIIIPAYNESAVIEKNMRKLDSFLKERGFDYEIIVVSDGSRDNTREIVRENLVCDNIIDGGYDDNRGKGGALKAGVKVASGDIIVTTDADLAYGTDVIEKAILLMQESPDIKILIGSRSIAKDGFAGYPPIRRLASKVYFKMLSIYAGLKVSDSQCGFKCYRNSAAKLLFGELESFGFAFDLEILLRAKKHKIGIHEMPVVIQNHGESKINVVKDSLRMLSDVTKIKKRCQNKKG